MTFKTKRYKISLIVSIIFSFTFSLSAFIVISLYDNGSTGNTIIKFTIPIIIFSLLYLFLMRKYRHRNKILKTPFPPEWREILVHDVLYYSSLNDIEKKQFEEKVQIFLGEKMITGIKTDIDDKCRILTASSAIIPVLKFPEWEYERLQEILIYPSNFDDDFSFSGKDNNILGMVISNTSSMIISKPMLYYGFEKTNDKANVGIHEFIHKVDGEDGAIDGIPALLGDKKLILEWKKIAEDEITKINNGKSDINPYGATNDAEFFAVASEYFFENPQTMMDKHPELYKVLRKIFRQDTYTMFKSVLKSMFRKPGKRTGRNSPCPCGSGEKYKKCCLNKND